MIAPKMTARDALAVLAFATDEPGCVTALNALEKTIERIEKGVPCWIAQHDLDRVALADAETAVVFSYQPEGFLSASIVLLPEEAT